MVTLQLTPKQAQLLSLHTTPVESMDHTVATQDTIPFTVDPVLLEGLRYTAIMRASPILQMHEWPTWKEIVYVITNAMVVHKLGLPQRSA